MEKTFKILAVDDDPDILFGTVRILTQAGYDVDEADSVAAANRCIQENKYDLILLDVVLQDGTGLDILKRIKSDDTISAFVVMVSGTRVTTDDQADGLDLGADGYITRPFEKRHFLSYIQALLRIKQAEDRTRSLLKEREILIKEVHHRVKNNFNIVASLLNLQSNQIGDEKTRMLCRTSRDRIRTMAIVHEQLYKSEKLTEISAAQYLRDLALGLFKSHNPDRSCIALKIDIDDIKLDADRAVPCGLIVNELMINALKHAFPPSFEAKGEIKISCHLEKTGLIELSIQDNGIGIPETLDIHQTDSLGLKLVFMLVEEQLQGRLDLHRKNGTRFLVQFPQEN